MWGCGGAPAPSASTVFPAPALTQVTLTDESFGVRVTLLSEACSRGQQAFFVLAPKMRLRHRLFLACPIYLKLRERNICLGRDTQIMDTVDRMSSRCCPAGVPWQGQEAPMGQGGARQVNVALLRGCCGLALGSRGAGPVSARLCRVCGGCCFSRPSVSPVPLLGVRSASSRLRLVPCRSPGIPHTCTRARGRPALLPREAAKPHSRWHRESPRQMSWGRARWPYTTPCTFRNHDRPSPALLTRS